jgi:hypothetical protein
MVPSWLARWLVIRRSAIYLNEFVALGAAAGMTPTWLPRVKWTAEVDYSIAITRNLFIDLVDLIQRGLVDRAMILRKLLGIIIKDSPPWRL